jgi:cleavage stimulation factor subunit 3
MLEAMQAITARVSPTDKHRVDARVLFETVVNKLTQTPEKIHRTKALFAYFHTYDSQYGELAQITKLEQRMSELFPEDPKLALFSRRYSTSQFDPVAARIIISPSAQLRPKALIQSVEAATSRQNSPHPTQFLSINSPRPAISQMVNSPKRPLALDDVDDGNPPRKIMRGDQNEFQRGVSPLKGAAGRRLDQQRRMQGQGGGGGHYQATPAPVSRDITFMMGLFPRADTYRSVRFDSNTMVRLLRDSKVPDELGGSGGPPALRGGNGPVHNRQVSSDHWGQYGYHSRDSPNPQGGPGGARAPTTYRQSSLRPGSSGSYEPPPATFSQPPGPAPPVGYGALPPTQPDPNAWQAFGGGPAPPPMVAPGYGQPPPSAMGYAQGQYAQGYRQY